jgi:hypothetical protein
MFEYWLFGLRDPNGYDSAPYVHTATTHDFLQVCADIAKHYGPDVAGLFVTDMLRQHEDKLDFIRVVDDWNFELTFSETDPRKIILRKVA